LVTDREVVDSGRDRSTASPERDNR
jgi:hypothetical protein